LGQEVRGRRSSTARIPGGRRGGGVKENRNRKKKNRHGSKTVTRVRDPDSCRTSLGHCLCGVCTFSPPCLCVGFSSGWLRFPPHSPKDVRVRAHWPWLNSPLSVTRTGAGNVATGGDFHSNFIAVLRLLVTNGRHSGVGTAASQRPGTRVRFPARGSLSVWSLHILPRVCAWGFPPGGSGFLPTLPKMCGLEGGLGRG